MLEQLTLTVIMTSVPLIFAATGELVAERSGVLNLGVEGMMLMGAVAAFAAAFGTGNLFSLSLPGGLRGRSQLLFSHCSRLGWLLTKWQLVLL